MDIMKSIKETGIVPVIVLSDAADAVPLADALADGGIRCVEVTLRTSAGLEAIRRICMERPEMLTGVGTVMTVEQAEACVQAGARFIVTPGLNEPVMEYCIENDIPVFPGCMDTYAIEKAVAAGLRTVKFFPAEPAGGLAMLKALAAPYSDLFFMPTGGINASNLAEYTAFDRIIAVGGSWMCRAEQIEKGDFTEIRRLSAEAVSIVRAVRAGKHDEAGEGA